MPRRFKIQNTLGAGEGRYSKSLHMPNVMARLISAFIRAARLPRTSPKPEQWKSDVFFKGETISFGH